MKRLMRLVAALLLVLFFAGAAAAFRLALPGYHFTFPRDHASHDDFKTEWWYYTGHLLAEDGSRFGYELTFFRSGLTLKNPVQNSIWTVRNIYLTHFAVSDISANKFVSLQRTNRAGAGIAGADLNDYRVWNGDWTAKLQGVSHVLKATGAEYSIDLSLTPEKPPAVHGKDGVSQKASCKGCASHYYSLTRLNTTGKLLVDGKVLKVTGVSWMDHEFGSNQLTAEQIGWDWYSLQFDDKTEVMLYVMRRLDGTIDANSSGTICFPNGSTKHLSLKDFKIIATGRWRSPQTKALYPMGWQVDIPVLELKAIIRPSMEDQELVTSGAAGVTYWEGASTIGAIRHGRSLNGVAYVEMTGYAQRFRNNI